MEKKEIKEEEIRQDYNELDDDDISSVTGGSGMRSAPEGESNFLEYLKKRERSGKR